MIYAMIEDKSKEQVPFPVTLSEARKLNSEGNYGIFRAVNDFGESRKIVHLKRINAWHVEIDGNKKAQLIKIKNSPIWPSRVIESKNGYHIYFNAIDASLENHKTIESGLIHYFGGDPRAQMVTVILREPGFLHKKDPLDPFEVKEIFSLDVRYREDDMFYFFPAPPQTKKEKNLISVSSSNGQKSTFNESTELSDFLNNLDHEWALSVLSGTSYVAFETYTFKDVHGGKKNIWVNGKSTRSFIDENKMIGANPGGPTIYQWLRYFNHTDGEIYKILKELFGEGLK